MAGKYRVGKSWYLTWVEGGRQRRVSIGKVTEAAAEIRRLAKEQALATKAEAGPDFADFAVEYGEWHRHEYPDSYYRTEQILRCHLIPTFGALPLTAISRASVEEYKRRRLAEVSAGTVVKEIKTLQAVLNAAVYWETIPNNPVRYVSAPRNVASRPPRWFTVEELARIYAVELEIRKHTNPGDAEIRRRLRWAWQLMANTGIRRGEAAHLQWRDVGAKEIGIRSERDARTKSGKWRSIPISLGARESLDELKSGENHVIPQISPPSVTRSFRRTLARADIEGSLHSLRHTYCAHLVQNGVPLRTVQILAGHASSKTTEIYAHLAPSNLRDAVENLRL